MRNPEWEIGINDYRMPGQVHVPKLIPCDNKNYSK